MNEPRALNLRIQHGSESSLDLLRPLWFCLHHHHQRIAPHLAPYANDDASWQTRRRFYADCLSQSGSFVLLAYSQESLVGYALVLIHPTSSMWGDTWVLGDRTAELETIVVAPEWRGKGVGDFLLDRVESELEHMRITDVIIGALPQNIEVLEWYRCRGFEPTWLVMTRFAARSEAPMAADHVAKK